jgi:hypothetical protein
MEVKESEMEMTTYEDETPVDFNEQQESTEDRFKKMAFELQCRNGWSPRKAARYLNAIARRQVEKHLRPKGLKVVRQQMKRYAFVPVNYKKLQAEKQQKEYAAQIQTQLQSKSEPIA